MKRLVALGTGLITVVAAAPAAAGPPAQQSLGRAGGLEYHVATLAGVDSPADGPSVACDPGDAATGGGVSISGDTAQGRLVSTYPTSLEGDGWSSEGLSLSGSPKTVRTWAICAGRSIQYETGSHSLAPPYVAISAYTHCDQGDRLTGGGVRVNAGRLAFTGLIPGSSAWTVHAGLIGSQEAIARTYAGCSGALDLVLRRSRRVEVPPGGGKAVARCPRGDSVTGGGLEIGARPAWAHSTQPWDSGDQDATPENGWLARAHNDSSIDGTLTAYAICKQ